MKRMLTLAAVLLCLAAPLAAQTVTLAWDPHPEAAMIEGFRLYQTKTAGSYGTVPVATFTPGSAVTGTIPKPGLGRFCWTLTAFTADAESDRSNEVCEVMKPKPPVLKSALLAILKAPVTAFRWAFGGERKGLQVLKVS